MTPIRIPALAADTVDPVMRLVCKETSVTRERSETAFLVTVRQRWPEARDVFTAINSAINIQNV